MYWKPTSNSKPSVILFIMLGEFFRWNIPHSICGSAEIGRRIGQSYPIHEGTAWFKWDFIARITCINRRRVRHGLGAVTGQAVARLAQLYKAKGLKTAGDLLPETLKTWKLDGAGFGQCGVGGTESAAQLLAGSISSLPFSLHGTENRESTCVCCWTTIVDLCLSWYWNEYQESLDNVLAVQWHPQRRIIQLNLSTKASSISSAHLSGDDENQSNLVVLRASTMQVPSNIDFFPAIFPRLTHSFVYYRIEWNAIKKRETLKW